MTGSGNNVRMLFYSSRADAWPMPRFVFKFIRISVDGENIENDTKTIMWTENTSSVFGANAPFSNLSGLEWTGP